MSDIKNVCQWVKNEKTGKSRTIKLGYAKEDNKGKLRITLDSLPVPRKNNFGDYSIELCLEEPYNQDGGGGGHQQRREPPPDDSDVPF